MCVRRMGLGEFPIAFILPTPIPVVEMETTGMCVRRMGLGEFPIAFILPTHIPVVLPAECGDDGRTESNTDGTDFNHEDTRRHTKKNMERG